MIKRRLLLAGGAVGLATVYCASWRSTGSQAAESFDATYIATRNGASA